MIYDFAYGRNKQIELVRISRGLVALEFGPRGRPYEVLACPNRRVVGSSLAFRKNRKNSDRQKPRSVHQQRMVSKRYLQESMCRLAEVNTYRCDRQNVVHHDFVSESFFSQIRSLVIIWSHHLLSSTIDLPALCPRLQALTIRIDSDHIPELCSDLSPTSKMQATALARSLVLLRGIKSFRLIDRPSFLERERMGSDFRAHKPQRKANVRQLEEVLHKMVQGTPWILSSAPQKTRRKVRSKG